MKKIRQLFLYHAVCGYEWPIEGFYRSVVDWWMQTGRISWCGRCKAFKDISMHNYEPRDVELRFIEEPKRSFFLPRIGGMRKVERVPFTADDDVKTMRANGWQKHLTK